MSSDPIKLSRWCAASLFVNALLLGVILCHLFHLFDFFDISKWIFSGNVEQVKALSDEKSAMLGNLVLSGMVISAPDLLGNFASYYQMLIALLVTFIASLAAFITFNAYKSKSEYDELLAHRLHLFFKNFEKDASTDKFGDLLNEYEELQSYLRKQVYNIVVASPELAVLTTNVDQTAIEVLETVIYDQVQSLLTEEMMRQVYDYCEQRKAAERQTEAY